MTGAKFDIEKFDGTGDFGLWRIKMRALLIQHGCEAALEVLPADTEAQTKAELNKKAHSAVILCLGNKVLREVTGETTAAGVWSKLETLYMTKSLANKLYLKKKLYTFYIPAGRNISEHIDEFNKIVFDLANIEVKFKNEDLALLLLTSLPASYEHFVDTLLYEREALTLEDVMTTLNSKEIKERSKAKWVMDHLKRNCPKNNRKKSTRYVKKDEQPSSSGSTYDDYEDMMVMSIHAQALLDWIMDSRCSYHMTHRLDNFFYFLECDGGSVQLGDNRECTIRGIGKVRVQLKDGSSFVLHNVRYNPELKRTLISLGTLEKERYTVKLHSGKVKVINGYRVILSGIRRDNCVHSLDGHVMAGELNASVKEKDSLAQLCIESGIARHLTVVGMPQQNRVAERMNRTLMDKVGVELQRLNNHTPKEDQTDQEDDDDEDAGDQATDQPPDLIDYQLVWDRETRTRTKPLRFRDENMDSLRKKKTWELVDHRAGQKLVSCKWMFKIYEGIEGVQKPRYKAKLMACRFTHRTCIDYNEVFSPVVRYTSIRAILALTTCKDYELEQLDVKTTFLHEILEEVIYMKQPPGYEQGNKVCLLKKFLYGLKQSLRQWYKRFNEYMLNNEFKRSSYDNCVYYRHYAPSEYIYLLLYVDDMLIGCKSKAEIGSTKSLLKKEFDMKELGEAKKILGMKIVRDRSHAIGGHFKLSLKDYPVRDCDVERMSKVPYASAVESLMYLMVCTRSDIAYAVSVVSRYLANPGKNHWEAVKWILKYLWGTANLGLVYETNRGNHVDVTGSVDLDYAKDPDKGVELNTVVINCDNQGAIHLSRNHVFHERTKHINVRYYFIRKVLEAKTVKVLKANIKPKVEIVEFSLYFSKSPGGLMFKWIWRFHTQESSLWVRIIKAIHGADGKIGATMRAGTRSCWLNIVNETMVLMNKGINLMNYMHVKLGDGMKTAFWEDAWSEGGKLKHRFPRIYALENCKSIFVGMKMAQPCLEFSFRRDPRGGVERDQFEELMELVNAVSLAPVADRWKWDLESSGDFSVASVRTTIDDKLLPASDYKTRWIKYVPIKINIHAWKVMSNALPTRFNISRRGICIDNIKCAICHEGVETVSHLFFSCAMVRQVTHLITRWWSVNEVSVQSNDGCLRLPATNKQMFEGVFYVMWWLLWTFRNKLIFEAKTPLKAVFFDDLVWLSNAIFMYKFELDKSSARIIKSARARFNS
nr:retrovirus-related Pol polyprotein from transposon TNT 1-94 [Tanacetum cinerariifolium]